mmetsp:Transcript_75496/g.125886  ORF Transcript_75496/g.125886 Transcript_75496/m.125886 type:complete len:360 (-) Transcript_75496:327-1406(-)
MRASDFCLKGSVYLMRVWRMQMPLFMLSLSRLRASEDLVFEHQMSINGLKNPTYATVMRDGKLIISDTGNARLLLVSAKGQVIGQLAPGQFSHPTGSAMVGDALFVAQQLSLGMQKVLLNGSVLASTRPSCEPWCANQCSELNGDAYYECGGCSAAWSCNFDRKRHNEYPQRRPIDSALGVIAGDGAVFVADVTAYDVRKYDEALNEVLSITQANLQHADTTGCQVKRGDGPYDGASCFNPHGLALAHNRLYVTDADNNRVLVFSASSGQWLFTIGGGSSTLLTMPRGIAIGNNRLWVAERRQLLLLTLHGKLLHTLSIPSAQNILGLTLADNHAFAVDPTANAIFIARVNSVGSNNEL